MSNKFAKFLEEPQVVKHKTERRTPSSRPQVVRDGEVSSIKISKSTLADLVILKALLSKSNYATLIDDMLQEYIETLPVEIKEKFDILRQND